MDRQGCKGMSLNDRGIYQYFQLTNNRRKHIPKIICTHSKTPSHNVSLDFKDKKSILICFDFILISKILI